jgi:hypothetical protein
MPRQATPRDARRTAVHLCLLPTRFRPMPRLLLLSLVSTLLVGCREAGDDGVPSLGGTGARRPYAPYETGSAASTPWLAPVGDSALVLSWTERLPDSSARVRFTTWSFNGWEQPRTVTERRNYFVNWADFPSVVSLGGGRFAAHWLEREGDGKYSYGVRIAHSSDSGQTWSAPITPHTDGLAAEHGFVSLWAADSGSIGAVWLDGRKSAMPDSAKEMTLRTARIRPDGSLADEGLLDARICDCCQTSTAATRRGRVVVYRNRTADEMRDIGIVRQVDGTWTAPALVHADNWRIEGCPVNGPAVAAVGDTVAVAWFTKAQDSARVRLAISRDGGATFAAPVRIDDGDPMGRVALVFDADAQPIVSWVERGASERNAILLARRVSLEGKRSKATEVEVVPGSRMSGFPRMVRVRDSLVFAYTTRGRDEERPIVNVRTVPVR